LRIEGWGGEDGAVVFATATGTWMEFWVQAFLEEGNITKQPAFLQGQMHFVEMTIIPWSLGVNIVFSK